MERKRVFFQENKIVECKHIFHSEHTFHRARHKQNGAILLLPFLRIRVQIWKYEKFIFPYVQMEKEKNKKERSMIHISRSMIDISCSMENPSRLREDEKWEAVLEWKLIPGRKERDKRSYLEDRPCSSPRGSVRG